MGMGSRRYIPFIVVSFTNEYLVVGCVKSLSASLPYYAVIIWGLHLLGLSHYKTSLEVQLRELTLHRLIVNCKVTHNWMGVYGQCNAITALECR